MKTKGSKTIWIVLAVIFILIAGLSFTNCLNSSKSVDTSEFDYIVSSAKDGILRDEIVTENSGAPVIKDDVSKNTLCTRLTIDDVVFDAYVINFNVNLYAENGNLLCTLKYTTNYSRDTNKIALIENALREANVSYT